MQGCPVIASMAREAPHGLAGSALHRARTLPHSLHAHSPVAASGARLALSRKRVRIVYTEHNVWERYHPLTRWGNVLTFPRNDHVFAVSDEVRAGMRYPRVMSWRPMPPVETLYHGIDPASVDAWTERGGVREELGDPRGRPIVGTIASFKAHKRLDVLLLVADRVRRELPDVRFILVAGSSRAGDTRDGSITWAGGCGRLHRVPRRRYSHRDELRRVRTYV